MRSFWYGVLGVLMMVFGIGDALWGGLGYTQAERLATPLPLALSWVLLSLGTVIGGLVLLATGLDASDLENRR